MYYQDQAIVLKRQDLREDDLRLICYTQKHGKMSFQVKGAKKILSKLAGHVEPLNLVRINWVAGKGSNKLIGADVIKSFKEIKNEYQKVMVGFYCVNLIDQATRLYHADKKIFLFLKSVLEKLMACDEKDLALIKLSFDYKFLYLTGHDASQRKELSQNEKQVAQQIVRLSVNDILQKNFDKNILNNLYLKSKIFLEEVLEREVVGVMNDGS